MNKEQTQSHRQALGAKLKEAREAAGITTYQVTKAAGLRFEAIQSIEKGDKSYTVDSLLVYLSQVPTGQLMASFAASIATPEKR